MGTLGSTADGRRLAAMRLAAQGITGPERATPGEVVRSMLAMQGQDLPGVRWSIGLRGGGITDAAVRAAFDSGDIVRSWPMRGTLHVTAAEDLPWMLDLMGHRAIGSRASRRADLGITGPDLERARDAAVAALGGGRALDRQALLSAIAGAGVVVDAQRSYHILGQLALSGTIVFGPTAGNGQAFVLLADWVPSPRRLGVEEALGEVAARYYQSHGPATEQDLARWSGLPLGDARRGVAVCGDRLARIEIGGTRYLVAPAAAEAVWADAAGQAASEPAASVVPDVRLLPGFDEYLLGYQDRSAVLAPEHAQAIVPGSNGMFLSTVVVDGEVVGTWKRTARAKDVRIEVSPFRRLAPGVRDALPAAASAYGAFLGKPVHIG